ncbi:hypothetical protein [Paenibacillus sp. GCM10027626]|uniref:hypothetical protein n=1 Tax=Paenibacillus sp. GCM10027626 TaxID=3273411 RepID=UPI00363F779A
MGEVPQYADIQTPDGGVLRVLYEITIGDMVVSTFIALLLLYLIINGITKKLWGR